MPSAPLDRPRKGGKRRKRRLRIFFEFAEIQKQNTQENKGNIFNFQIISSFFLLACNIVVKITNKLSFQLIFTEFSSLWKLLDFADVFLLNLQQIN